MPIVGTNGYPGDAFETLTPWRPAALHPQYG